MKNNTRELKDAIVKSIQENLGISQLNNFTINNFRIYIYNEKGNYLIGGEEIAKFISEFIKIYE